MSEAPEEGPIPVHKKRRRHRKKQLYTSILKQMEFYFSDAALSKDRFLSQLLERDPWVPLEIFLRFNKIKVLTTNTLDIAQALQPSSLLQVSPDNTKVSRVSHITPQFTQRGDTCTSGSDEQLAESEEPQRKKSAPPELPFRERVIVEAQLAEPCCDAKEFRRSTKQNIHVQFVDVREGQTTVHIRMDEPEHAEQLAASGVFLQARVLAGSEERQYWEQLQRQRAEKAGGKRGLRGRERLIRRAQQLLPAPPHPPPKHIHFEE